MRKISKKTAAIYRKWGPVRKEFLWDHPYCFACGSGIDVAVHEMTPGKNRMRGFVERATWLTACNHCNCDRLTDASEWPLARQLALKLLHNPEYFDLEAVRRVLAPEGCENPPRVVDESEILEEVRFFLMKGHLTRV